MAKILLTGATGGTGAVILEKLLREGYSVTAVVRSFAKSRAALEERYHGPVESGQLQLLEVLDMASPGAFDEAAKGAVAIMHVAAPITNSDIENTMIRPGWVINENVLKAASASPSVKRVIVTGSLAGVMKIPDHLMSGKTFTEDDYNPVTHEEAVNDTSGLRGYQYSKANAERKTWAWIETNKPRFDVVYLLAPAITGRSIQAGFVPDKSARGGNAAIYRELFDRDAPGSMFPYFMDVDDVAEVHVKALSPSVEGNHRYPFHAPELMFAGPAAEHVREVFPQLRDRVPPSDAKATLPPKLSRFNISRFERTFGTNWKGWRESVAATVESIVEHEKR